ncbi:hypothetical protein GQR42_02640 [Microcystis aeruginosa FD4]|uniref:Uncharacterized protein n=1 Tax=Microcystis aeruginosa FD4 TaxID=2686288 RepID=A0A857CZP3_MICAE|nr:hypothetical protein GQR42_02640 [Microcystis aeruginosa FD4]
MKLAKLRKQGYQALVEVSMVLLGKQKQTQTPWESSARKIFSGDIENLSCLVEQGISDSDLERIPRHSVA